MFKQVCWGNRIFLIMVMGLFFVSLLSGCGPKGDLYLPKAKAADTTQDKQKTK